ncbi:hypothetical protein L9F63_003621, partial [Diploptera punctata]
ASYLFLAAYDMVNRNRKRISIKADHLRLLLKERIDLHPDTGPVCMVPAPASNDLLRRYTNSGSRSKSSSTFRSNIYDRQRTSNKT